MPFNMQIDPWLAAVLWAGAGVAISPLICAAMVALPKRASVRAMLASRWSRDARRYVLPLIGTLLALHDGIEPHREAVHRLLAEAGLALAFGWLMWHHGMSWMTVVLSVYCSVFVIVIGIDVEHHLILNNVLAPAAIFALLVAPTLPGLTLSTALIGAIVGFAVLLLPALIMPGGMGGGDVKLAGFLGMATGFPGVLTTLSMGILLGGVTTMLLLGTRRISRRENMPYGPFLIAGAMLVLLTW